MTRKTIDHFVGGQFTPPDSGSYLNNMEPAAGNAYSQVAAGGPADVEAAVEAATAAFPAWSHRPAEERSRILLRIADLLEQRLEEFARAESVDNGKPVSLARAVDIPRAIRNMRFFATAILHQESEAQITDHTALNYTLRRPLGVCALISPWNLPLYLFTWKVAPALATGNTAIAKPSELTPMTAAMFCDLCQEAGLPAGVLNVLHGRGPEVGAPITTHPQVKAVSFTGGTVTGEAIARVAAPQFKKLSLELGGKNPTLVFADADFDTAVATSVRAAFSNQGEICLCGSRVFVERSIYDEFLAAFVERVRGFRVGDPLEADTDQGALVSAAHRDKVRSYLELAADEGATFACGGLEPPAVNDRCANGYFVQPSVLTGLPFDCRTNQEEIFGPVVSVMPFESEEEVVAQANSTRYGLAASLWTGDVHRAHRLADRLDSGIVWVNCWMLRDLRVPFGGVKASGVGREGGLDALRFFTEAKNVCVGLAKG